MLRTVLFALVLVSPLAATDFTLAAPPPGDPSSTPLPTGKPWVPGWCRWDWRAGWVAQHQAFVGNTNQNAGKIRAVFYGDSLTQGWGSEAKDVFQEHFGRHGAVNYGIGGDSTRQLLYRISHGEVDGIMPRVIVLCIGTNNLYDDANGGSDEEIATGITTVVHLIQHKLPHTRILLVGLLPRQNDWFSGRVKRINGIIAKLDDGKSVRFLDVGSRFASAPGKMMPELYHQDQLHLVRKGYETWAAALKPLFDELMGK
jgi:beta-glucosidase